MGKLVIKPSLGKTTVIASEYLLLDSSVYTGGGTDQTDEIQAILDAAQKWGGLHLVMDGAALVYRCLKVHSNTTIECRSRDCGFFLASGADSSLLCNAGENMKEIVSKNISLLGGTYNFNSPGQNRYKGFDPSQPLVLEYDQFIREWTNGMRFCGVENLLLRDLTLLNQRTFAALFACWKNVVIENVDIPLPDNQFAQNQDGLHFFGPGSGLSIKNISGCSGDDFIALAPDEHDGVSDITDVVIDGVYLRDADQGIRMLSRNKGRLDRVFIRNVYGTYKSCGFYINPWFGEDGHTGNYGSITLENIHMQPTYHKYADYCRPFLFRIGGYIESLTIKGVKCIDSADNRPLIDVSHAYSHWTFNHKFVHIVNLTIDGLEVLNASGAKEKTAYISVDGTVDNLVVRNVLLHRPEGNENDDALIMLKDEAEIGVLYADGIIANGTGEILEREDGAKTRTVFSGNIIKNGKEIKL